MNKKLRNCALHALALTALHLLYYNLNLTMPLENELMGFVGKFQNYVRTYRDRDTQYLFVNTAGSGDVVPAQDTMGNDIRVAITDRALLARLFSSLAAHGNQHRFLLCDLVFDYPSQKDGALLSQFGKLENFIVPVSQGNGHTALSAALQSTAAVAEYITYEGKISKMQLYSRGSGTKTLPLRMYEKSQELHMKRNLLGFWQGTKYLPLSIYPKFFYTNDQLQQMQIDLGNLVQLLEADDSMTYHVLLKGKTIVLGNFESDVHLTNIGQRMPGSLILFNTYLTLQSVRYSVFWLPAIFVLFFLLSYFELYVHIRVFTTTRWSFLFGTFSLAGICVLLSFLCSLVFGITTTILPVILYFHLWHVGHNFFYPKPLP